MNNLILHCRSMHNMYTRQVLYIPVIPLFMMCNCVQVVQVVDCQLTCVCTVYIYRYIQYIYIECGWVVLDG